MSLAAASHAAALCRPTVSGTSRSRPAAFASCEQHRGRLDAPGVASVAPASTVRLARGRRGRPSTTVTRAHVGDPEWFANQALAATVVVTLIFIFLSGINHLLTTARAAGFQIHTFRFLGAVVLAAVAAPVVHMWGVL